MYEITLLMPQTQNINMLKNKCIINIDNCLTKMLALFY